MSLTLPLDHAHLQKLVTADLVRPDQVLGAHPITQDGVAGVRFGVWAPNAQHVSVVGDFNGWNGFDHPMQRLDFGYWGAFVPAAQHGQRYKFRVTGADGRTVDKSDPYGLFFETRPATSSIIWDQDFAWSDSDWMNSRSQGFDRAVSIYECHAPSWRKRDDGWFLNYRDLAHELGQYLLDLNYTHVELLGVMEHPFDGSWGYQVVQDGWTTPTPTPDTTAPVAGTLAVTVTDVKADLSVSGASDDRGYVQYSFSKDNGATWTAYQDSAKHTFTGLTASTAYTFRHRVKDAANNVTTGTAVSSEPTRAVSRSSTTTPPSSPTTTSPCPRPPPAPTSRRWSVVTHGRMLRLSSSCRDTITRSSRTAVRL